MVIHFLLKLNNIFYDICYKCNKKGHFANKCPNPRSDSGSRPSFQRSSVSDSTAGWKNTAPRSGQPTTKAVGGIEYTWCAKCRGNQGRWTNTHTTDTHKAGSTKRSPEANLTEGLDLASHGQRHERGECDDDSAFGELHGGVP